MTKRLIVVLITVVLLVTAARIVATPLAEPFEHGLSTSCARGDSILQRYSNQTKQADEI